MSAILSLMSFFAMSKKTKNKKEENNAPPKAAPNLKWRLLGMMSKAIQGCFQLQRVFLTSLVCGLKTLLLFPEAKIFIRW